LLDPVSSHRPSAPVRPASLQDEDVSIDFAEHTSPRDRAAVVVTEPLTKDETWSAFAPGEIRPSSMGRRS
jgi:glutamine amidotransferase